MHTFVPLSRMTLSQIENNHVFRSYLICRDNRNRLCIVGARSPLLEGYRRPYLDGSLREKRHMARAILNAHVHGRPMLTEQDLYQRTPVRFHVMVNPQLHPHEPVEVYRYD